MKRSLALLVFSFYLLVSVAHAQTRAVYLGDFLPPDVCLPIQKLRTYLAQRPDYVYGQMADYFQLGDTIPMTVSGTPGSEISINGIPLRTGSFNGKWFSHFPLSVDVTNDASATWTMVVTHADGSETTYSLDTAAIQPKLDSLAAGDSITLIATSNNP